MRLFLFKILFKLTWWAAPDRSRVNRIFDLYLEEIRKEEEFQKCQERQAYMNKFTRPKTYPKAKGVCTYTDYYERK